jgi:hypothetical protein
MRFRQPISSGFLKPVILTLMTYVLLFTQLAYAQGTPAATPNAGTMLINFAQAIPNLMRLVTACSYVMGYWFIFQAVMSFKEFGEARSQHSTHADHLKTSLILLVVGTLLLFLPSSVQTGLNTFWSVPNPYGYVEATTDEWSQVIQDSYLIVQLIGTIAFIRGLVIWSTLGGQAQPGTFGRGLTFVIAGVLCINLYDFINVIEATLDIQGVVNW